MADTKITALTALTAADPANDVLPIVDVSDTTMAASGTTKKISVNNILGASGTATLASATITGDLTVDTSTLKVDSANNFVGIGTASPVTTFTVSGEASLRVNDLLYWNAYYNSGFKARAAGYASNVSGNTAGDFVVANTASSAAGAGSSITFYDRYRISNSGVHTWEYVGGVAGTAMTLNSTGLGVGVTPTQKLELRVTPPTNGLDGLRVSNGTESISAFITGATYSNYGVGGNTAWLLSGLNNLAIGPYGGTGVVTVVCGGAERLRVDSSGNVGIGVTPSGGKGCLQLSSGINFPATQVASSDANTLDDYEEGTWTIDLRFGGASTGMTSNASVGRYTKIGRTVTVSGLLSLTSKGSSTGIAEIYGLPFTIANTAEAYSAANVRFNGVSFADVPISIGAIGSGKIILQEITKAGAVTDLTDADFTNTSSCIIEFTYTV